MRFTKRKGAGVLSILAIVYLALSGCASTYYTNLKPSEFTKTSDPKFYAIEQTLTSQRRAESWVEVDSTQGILPGTYRSALENKDGTLFFGSGRSYFVKYANDSEYYLRAGGFWIPKANGVSPKLFYIVDSSKILTAASIAEAISGSTTAKFVPSMGLIPDLFISSEDGHVVLVPTETGFVEKLLAELKPIDPPKPGTAR